MPGSRLAFALFWAGLANSERSSSTVLGARISGVTAVPIPHSRAPPHPDAWPAKSDLLQSFDQRCSAALMRDYVLAPQMDHLAPERRWGYPVLGDQTGKQSCLPLAGLHSVISQNPIVQSCRYELLEHPICQFFFYF